MTDLKRFYQVKKELQSFTLAEPDNFSYRAIHIGQDPKQWSSGALVPPIHTSTIYTYENQQNYDRKDYIYHRLGSPSKNVLEKCFANLNEANHALMFSSGQGATSSLLVSLDHGSHIIACKYLYGHTINLFQNEAVTMGLTVSFIDLSDLETLKNTITPKTKLVFFETPSNPTLKCFDIKKISKTVHNVNSEILVCVDNSFLSPFLQCPLKFGADIAMYSCSKYTNGHSDVIMGSLVMNSGTLFDKMYGVQVRMGNIPSAFDCYLVSRSLRTLDIRMKKHFKNALIVAKFLQSHPSVEKIAHPGLLTDPSHEIAVKQSSGHSGMIAVWLKGATVQQNKELLKKLKVIKVATSLGGVESTVITPFVTTANNISRDLKENVGVTENLFRLSVGLEEPQILIEDLNLSLNTLHCSKNKL